MTGPKAQSFDRQLRWLYVIPVIVVSALALERYLPLEGFGGSPQGGLWGAAGAGCALVFRAIYRAIGRHKDTPGESKVIAEKVKLLANTINVLSVVCIGAALAEPFRGNSILSASTIVLFFLAAYAHIGAQRFVSLMPSDE